MDKVTIADSLFLPHTKSAFLGGDNIGIFPSYFEWELANAASARFVTDSDIKHAKGDGQIAWLLEPFHLHPENYIEAMRKPFDYVLTSNLYFAENNENWLWVPHGGSWIDFNKHGIHEKTKNISMLMSDKNTMPGHKLRHQIAERFGDQIDVLSGVSAFEGYAPYKYSIVIENERTDGYFTEKLIDCLSVGTIPIYWGCPSIDAFFGGRQIISFDNAENLEYVIYHSFLLEGRDTWVQSNIDISKNYRIVEDWIYWRYPFLLKGK